MGKIEKGQYTILPGMEMLIDPDYNIKPTDYDKAQNVYNETEEFIGLFIRGVVIMENKIDELIQYFFMTNLSNDKSLMFKENILDLRSFTLFDKWKLFGVISKSEMDKQYYTGFSSQELKELRKDIHEIIEHRNILAHNRVLIEIPNFQCMIRFLKNGKTHRMPIKKKYMDNFKSTLGWTTNSLLKISLFYKNSQKENE